MKLWLVNFSKACQTLAKRVWLWMGVSGFCGVYGDHMGGKDEKKQWSECMVNARGSRSANIEVRITINYYVQDKPYSTVSLSIIKYAIAKSQGGTVNSSLLLAFPWSPLTFVTPSGKPLNWKHLVILKKRHEPTACKPEIVRSDEDSCRWLRVCFIPWTTLDSLCRFSHWLAIPQGDGPCFPIE